VTLGLGSPAAALAWAQQLIADLNAGAGGYGGVPIPNTPANQQFIYDWQESEGTGGANNPLNTGPLQGLSTSGSQFGGGAANYPSPAAAAVASADYLLNPGNQKQYGYGGILQALEQSNYQGAADALWKSDWASGHYGYGANWNTSPIPGSAQTAAAAVNLGSSSASSSPSSSAAGSSPANQAGQALGSGAASGVLGILGSPASGGGIFGWAAPRLPALAVAAVFAYMLFGRDVASGHGDFENRQPGAWAPVAVEERMQPKLAAAAVDASA
jgi:hypothetical protein